MIDVEPGDVLYVPPYTWHSVVTLSPSISLSSWSDFGNVRTLMTHLYRAQPHEFDSLVRRRGRLFALRTYIATLLHGIHGPNNAAAQAWIERHLSSRYRGLEHLFPSAFANITAEEYIPRLPIRCVFVQVSVFLGLKRYDAVFALRLVLVCASLVHQVHLTLVSVGVGTLRVSANVQ